MYNNTNEGNMEESVGNLFDSCDKSNSGKVAVPVLISALEDEVNKSAGLSDVELHQQIQVFAEAVSRFLDPLGTNLLVDKDTWIAAWVEAANTDPIEQHCAAITSSPQNMAAGDDFKPPDNSGFLDQSKHSYSYSPKSAVSSPEYENTKLTVLKQENEQLHTVIKALREQCQRQEDAVIQDEIERQNQERALMNEISRLDKQCQKLQLTNEELQSRIDTCEQEKLLLSINLTKHSDLEKKLQMKLLERQREINALSKEIDEQNEFNSKQTLEIDVLRSELDEKTKIFSEVLNDLQGNWPMCIAEKDKLCSQGTSTYLVKKNLSSFVEECEIELNNNLQRDTGLEGSSMSTCLFDNVIPSTPKGTQSRNENTENSLLEELQAVGVFSQCDEDFDCSFDLVQDFSFQSANQSEKSMTATINDSIVRKKGKDDQACILVDPPELSEVCLNVISKEDHTRLNSFNDRGQKVGDLPCCVALEKTDKCVQTTAVETFNKEILVKMDADVLDSLSSIRYNGDRGLLVNSASQTEDILVYCSKALERRDQSSQVFLKMNNFGTQTKHTCETDSSLVTTTIRPLWTCNRINIATAVAILGFFILLLVCSTILFTSAILDEASESGVFTCLHRGSVPPWLKYIVRPFLSIRRGTVPI